MRYHFLESTPIKRGRGKGFLFALPIIGIVAGSYALITAFSPMLAEFPGIDGSATAMRLSAEPGTHGDRLYIPQINVDMAILAGESESVLQRGAWHRGSGSGNPVDGGNFVLSANRFVMGMTPGETRVQSPLYNIDKLEIGHQIFVDYDGKRYGYEIIKKVIGGSDLSKLEAPSKDAKLTLYPWEPKGASSGDAMIAKPLGTVEKLEIGS